MLQQVPHLASVCMRIACPLRLLSFRRGMTKDRTPIRFPILFLFSMRLPVPKYLSDLTAISHGRTFATGVVCFYAGIAASNRARIMNSFTFFDAHHDLSLPELQHSFSLVWGSLGIGGSRRIRRFEFFGLCVELAELEIRDSRDDEVISQTIQEPVDAWNGCQDDREIEYCSAQLSAEVVSSGMDRVNCGCVLPLYVLIEEREGDVDPWIST